MVILPGCNTDEALQIAEAIRHLVEEAALPHEKGDRGVVTVSIGVASTSDTEADDIKTLIAAADANLYRAKEAGRNRVMA